MGTRSSVRPGFFATADHAAAREFGRRHYRGLVTLRFVRATWLFWLVVVLVSGAAALIAWGPDFPAAPHVRLPDLPWGVIGIGAGSLLLISGLFSRALRFRLRILLFRIGL